MFSNIDYYKEIYQERIGIMVENGKTENEAQHDALYDTHGLFCKDNDLTPSNANYYTVINKIKSR